CGAEAALLVLVFLDALVCKGCGQVERDYRQQRPQQEGGIDAFAVAAKAEADAAVAGVVQLELQAAPDQPRRDDQQCGYRQQAHQIGNLESDVVEDDQDEGDDASLQDGDGIAVVFGAAAGDLRAAVEITRAAHLGPCGIDSQRDDG